MLPPLVRFESFEVVEYGQEGPPLFWLEELFPRPARRQYLDSAATKGVAGDALFPFGEVQDGAESVPLSIHPVRRGNLQPLPLIRAEVTRFQLRGRSVPKNGPKCSLMMAVFRSESWASM